MADGWMDRRQRLGMVLAGCRAGAAYRDFAVIARISFICHNSSVGAPRAISRARLAG
jgi:hypothetical protein